MVIPKGKPCLYIMWIVQAHIDKGGKVRWPINETHSAIRNGYASII